jgi:copper chaperone CopZ
VGVFLLAETADVQLDPAVVQLDAVVEAIEGAGFSAKLLSSTGTGL